MLPVVQFCYHLYNLKNMKNTHAEVLLLVKFQAEACNFTKSNTPHSSLGVFLVFKIEPMVRNQAKRLICLLVNQNKIT